MSQAFDTNVLAYAAAIERDRRDERKLAIAEQLIGVAVAAGQFVLPAQVCAEFHNLLVRKLGATREEASEHLADYTRGARIVPTDLVLLEVAFDLAASHRLQTFDAIILAAAAEAGCDVLYSEDLQDGFTWRGVRVVNPFKA